MANLEHLELLGRGVAAWNLWRVANPLIRPNFNFASLNGADLRQANLSNAILSVADLNDANLGFALMVGADMVGTFMRHASLERATLTDANLFQANLYRANLRGADLRGANLAQADLREADLRETDLRAAGLRSANLRGTNLDGANLDGADLSRASLVEASCRGTLLSGADLSGAFLGGADLTEARAGWTRFGDADLSAVQGLESVVHVGPSTMGIDTVFRSRGQIPETFLGGAGVPDVFVTYMTSLTAQPIEFYSCFISAGPDDRLFCDRLFADLRVKGVRTWYVQDEPTPAGGAGWEVDRSLKVYDKLVVVCSGASLRRGGLTDDLEQALSREEYQGKRVLFPILLDEYARDGWGYARRREVLERVVADFTNWDHAPATYAAAFEALLEALQGGG